MTATRLLAHLYALLLRLYPPHFRAEFGEEMQVVFSEAAKEAAARGALGLLLLRELSDAPSALVRAYWDDWTKTWQKGMTLIRDAASIADLPPPPPDGRESWRQVGWELSLFLFTGFALILFTYLPAAWLETGWHRNFDLLGRVVTLLTLPVFLIGLVRGLPRWAYPFGGLLLSHQALAANRTGVLPFLLASAILAVIALITDMKRSPLPMPVRRIGQSLSLDWTRLSFGIYSALSLAILSAFDDAYLNNRTPYLALSVLGMILFALIYCRSRESKLQIMALLGGMSFSIWAALLDKTSFAGGLKGWTSAPRLETAEIAWLLELWMLWLALTLAPAFLTLAGRKVKP
jgi:hypothetical protein